MKIQYPQQQYADFGDMNQKIVFSENLNGGDFISRLQQKVTDLEAALHQEKIITQKVSNLQNFLSGNRFDKEGLY